MKFLINLLIAECIACCCVGLWIHEILLILAGLFCIAIKPILQKELTV